MAAGSDQALRNHQALTIALRLIEHARRPTPWREAGHDDNQTGSTTMGYANCTVTFSNGSVQSNPDPVTVSRATQDGVQWTFGNSGYTFTGVSINGVQAPTGDFGTPQISANPAGRSVMSVSDSVADLDTYSYTLQYVDAQGRPGQYDPQIKNEN
jgi:hypothetical protein